MIISASLYRQNQHCELITLFNRHPWAYVHVSSQQCTPPTPEIPDSLCSGSKIALLPHALALYLWHGLPLCWQLQPIWPQ